MYSFLLKLLYFQILSTRPMQTSPELIHSQWEMRAPIDFFFSFLSSLFLAPVLWARERASERPIRLRVKGIQVSIFDFRFSIFNFRFFSIFNFQFFNFSIQLSIFNFSIFPLLCASFQFSIFNCNFQN